MVKNKGLVGFFLAKMWELIQITEKKNKKLIIYTLTQAI